MTSSPAVQDVPAEVWLEQPNARAALTPSEGLCNTVFRILRGEEWVSTLAEPPSWEALRQRPAFFGDPLLFPFAYGVQGDCFTYEGRQHTLQPGREGKVIHGVVRDQAWTVEKTWTDDEGAHLRASFSVPEEGSASEALLAQFPFPYRLQATYSLRGTALTLALEATNLGERTMPMGLGIHPYFGLPLFPNGHMGDLILSSNAPYTRAMMPDPSQRFAPASGDYDMRTSPRLDAYRRAAWQEGKALLALYAMRAPQDESPTGPRLLWSLTDARHGLRIEIEASEEFPYVLNFAPPSWSILSPVVSTHLPGALNMPSGEGQGGIVHLQSQATWRGWVRLSARWEA